MILNFYSGLFMVRMLWFYRFYIITSFDHVKFSKTLRKYTILGFIALIRNKNSMVVWRTNLWKCHINCGKVLHQGDLRQLLQRFINYNGKTRSDGNPQFSKQIRSQVKCLFHKFVPGIKISTFFWFYLNYQRSSFLHQHLIAMSNLQLYFVFNNWNCYKQLITVSDH